MVNARRRLVLNCLVNLIILVFFLRCRDYTEKVNKYHFINVVYVLLIAHLTNVCQWINVFIFIAQRILSLFTKYSCAELVFHYLLGIFWFYLSSGIHQKQSQHLSKYCLGTSLLTCKSAYYLKYLNKKQILRL